MKISAEQLGYLLAECFNAISPDTDAAIAAMWRGKFGEFVETALRRDPDDALWAIEGCEEVLLPENGVDEVVQEYGAPTEDDRLWAAIEHDRIAQKGGDYAVPSQHEDPGDDIKLDFIWAMEPDNQPRPNEYDLPDPPESALVEQSGAVDMSAESSENAEVLAAQLAEASVASRPAPKTEGFLCRVTALDRVTVQRIRKRVSWVKSATHYSRHSGGRIDIVQVFADGARAESMTGYDQLIAGQRARGCCFEEALWIETEQDNIPLLASLPDGIVIDFPGIFPSGTHGEYGIVRMKRGKDRRWKVGIEWILPSRAAERSELFSDKVRIAIFADAKNRK